MADPPVVSALPLATLSTLRSLLRWDELEGKPVPESVWRAEEPLHAEILVHRLNSGWERAWVTYRCGRVTVSLADGEGPAHAPPSFLVRHCWKAPPLAKWADLHPLLGRLSVDHCFWVASATHICIFQANPALRDELVAKVRASLSSSAATGGLADPLPELDDAVDALQGLIHDQALDQLRRFDQLSSSLAAIGTGEECLPITSTRKDKSGVLSLAGWRGWRDFYFVLYEQALYFYKDSKSTTPAGFVTLRHAAVLLDRSRLCAGEFAFRVVTPLRVLACRAKHTVALSEWVIALEQAVARSGGGGGATGLLSAAAAGAPSAGLPGSPLLLGGAGGGGGSGGGGIGGGGGGGGSGGGGGGNGTWGSGAAGGGANGGGAGGGGKGSGRSNGSLAILQTIHDAIADVSSLDRLVLHPDGLSAFSAFLTRSFSGAVPSSATSDSAMVARSECSGSRPRTATAGSVTPRARAGAEEDDDTENALLASRPSLSGALSGDDLVGGGGADGNLSPRHRLGSSGSLVQPAGVAAGATGPRAVPAGPGTRRRPTIPDDERGLDDPSDEEDGYDEAGDDYLGLVGPSTSSPGASQQYENLPADARRALRRLAFYTAVQRFYLVDPRQEDYAQLANQLAAAHLAAALEDGAPAAAVEAAERALERPFPAMFDAALAPSAAELRPLFADFRGSAPYAALRDALTDHVVADERELNDFDMNVDLLFTIKTKGLHRSVEMVFDRKKSVLTIGRDKSNDLVIDDSRVSRSHARVEYSRTQCELIDLGSSCGSKLNGRPVLRSRLKRGDIVELGYSVLIFHTRKRKGLISLTLGALFRGSSGSSGSGGGSHSELGVGAVGSIPAAAAVAGSPSSPPAGLRRQRSAEHHRPPG